MRPFPTRRTAVLGALVSAGVAATMLATAAVHAPGPAPSAAATVQMRPHGPVTTAER
ncbi:hypothetical protein [Pseudonocardia lacus]|uniref:hypothetical protein n=1 Tax=Pseudonocardia lacus TaxID=2835865 RepID=UPI001BDC45C1|nr:hypothetical protein [Pseudonocardia lacus]